MATSVRLRRDLDQRLARAAEVTGKSTNRLINDAIEDYLRRLKLPELEREIERQCRLANRADRKDDWEAFADFDA
jgi:predicted transcriptional regulator